MGSILLFSFFAAVSSPFSVVELITSSEGLVFSANNYRKTLCHMSMEAVSIF
jgi:hypothetical protein